MIKKSAIIILGSLTLPAMTGCLSVSSKNMNPALPVNPPLAWSSLDSSSPPNSKGPDIDWLKSFQDPSLIILVEEALAHNQDVLQAKARMDAAFATARRAGSGLFPELNFRFDASRSARPGSSSQDSKRVYANSFSPNLSASWEADVWGRVRDTARAGTLDAYASQADYAAQRLSITGAVLQAWFTLLEEDAGVRLSERNLTTRQRSLRLTERRFSVGGNRGSDVRLARSAEARARAALATNLRTKGEAARNLKLLLGSYPDDRVKLADLPRLPPLEGVGQPADILTKRPDVIASEARLKAAGFNVQAARKALYPKLTLTGSLSMSESRFEDIFDLDRIIANIAGGLLQPVFQGGRLRAEIDRTKARAREQAAAYAGLVLKAFKEVEDALAAETLLSQREAALEVALKESSLAEERVEAQYGQGLATIFDLLNAQQQSITTERDLLSTRTQRLLNRTRLHIALGGSWASHASSSPLARKEELAP